MNAYWPLLDGDVIVWGINYGKESYKTLYDSLEKIRLGLKDGVLETFRSVLDSVFVNYTSSLKSGTLSELTSKNAILIAQFLLASDTSERGLISDLKRMFKKLTVNEDALEGFFAKLDEIRKSVKEKLGKKNINFKEFQDSLEKVADMLRDRIKLPAIALYILSGLGKSKVVCQNDLNREAGKFFDSKSKSVETMNYLKEQYVEFQKKEPENSSEVQRWVLEEARKSIEKWCAKQGWSKEQIEDAQPFIDNVLADIQRRMEPGAKIEEEYFQKKVALDVIKAILSKTSPAGQEITGKCKKVSDDFFDKLSDTVPDFAEGLGETLVTSFGEGYDQIKQTNQLTAITVGAMKKLTEGSKGMMLLSSLLPKPSEAPPQS